MYPNFTDQQHVYRIKTTYTDFKIVNCARAQGRAAYTSMKEMQAEVQVLKESKLRF
jgi:hypothetical protein